jgi:hypothetical protein
MRPGFSLQARGSICRVWNLYREGQLFPSCICSCFSACADWYTRREVNHCNLTLLEHNHQLLHNSRAQSISVAPLSLDRMVTFLTCSPLAPSPLSMPYNGSNSNSLQNSTKSPSSPISPLVSPSSSSSLLVICMAWPWAKSQAKPSHTGQAKSVGLELALAWPGLPESQSQWLRPWL